MSAIDLFSSPEMRAPSRRPGSSSSVRPDATAPGLHPVDISVREGDGQRSDTDWLAVEQALHIHIAGAPPLVTMRTPGHDRELAAGLLHGEGVVQEAGDIVSMRTDPADPDLLHIMLRTAARQRLGPLQRHTLMASACGVCGKQQVEPPRLQQHPPLTNKLRVSADWLLGLPAQLRARQGLFAASGGLHAAALFAAGGQLLTVHEDIGRHNALDKLVGHSLLQGKLPWQDHTLLLSGRASYELLQKAILARVPVVCAISAPSSYAVDLAQRFGITLVGFMRGERFNIYSGAERVQA